MPAQPSEAAMRRIPSGGRLSTTRIGCTQTRPEPLPAVAASVVLVPQMPEVVDWWNQESERDFIVKLAPCREGGLPHLHVWVLGRRPFKHEDIEANGVHAVIPLPDNALLHMCQIEWIRTDFHTSGTLTGAAPIRGLRVSFPLVPGRSPLKHLFFGFWPLLMPKLFWSRSTPVVQALVVCLVAVYLIVTCVLVWFFIRARAVPMTRRFLRRRQRLAQLRDWKQEAGKVTWSFDQEDCCICLEHLRCDEAELIMLLPCKHIVHEACYRDWIGSRSYVSAHLRCPFCSGRAQGLAVPQPPARVEAAV